MSSLRLPMVNKSMGIYCKRINGIGTGYIMILQYDPGNLWQSHIPKHRNFWNRARSKIVSTSWVTFGNTFFFGKAQVVSWLDGRVGQWYHWGVSSLLPPVEKTSCGAGYYKATYIAKRCKKDLQEIYIYLEPKCPLFDWKRPSFGGKTKDKWVPGRYRK